MEIKGLNITKEEITERPFATTSEFLGNTTIKVEADYTETTPSGLTANGTFTLDHEDTTEFLQFIKRVEEKQKKKFSPPTELDSNDSTDDKGDADQNYLSNVLKSFAVTGQELGDCLASISERLEKSMRPSEIKVFLNKGEEVKPASEFATEIAKSLRELEKLKPNNLF